LLRDGVGNAFLYYALVVGLKMSHRRAAAKLQEVCLHHRKKRANHTRIEAKECRG